MSFRSDSSTIPAFFDHSVSEARETAELGFDGIIGGRQHALEEGHAHVLKHFKVGIAVKVAELEDMEEGAEDRGAGQHT